MKSFIFLASIFLVISLHLFGQETDEYYKLPTQRKDVRYNAYPNLNRKAISLYFGLDGGFKQSNFSQNNNLNNLSKMIRGLEELHTIELTFKNANEGDAEGIEVREARDPRRDG